MRIVICGPSGSGKDVASLRLRDRHGFRFTGSCSVYITARIAQRLGISFAEAEAMRHTQRKLWREEGDRMRLEDPAALARLTLADGDICSGVRSRGEIRAVRAESLVDLILWVDRPGPDDDTLEFGPEEADILVPNRWGLAEFHRRIDRLASTWGLRHESSHTISRRHEAMPSQQNNEK